jgi:hypothetical protein
MSRKVHSSLCIYLMMRKVSVDMYESWYAMRELGVPGGGS